jgi:hypothetical protein
MKHNRPLAAFVAVLVLGIVAGAATPVAAQSGPICSKFDSGKDGFGPCTDAPNVSVETSTVDGVGKDDPYLHITDLSGKSRVCSSDPKFVGNWLEKMNGCGQLCFDFKVINSGYPPSAITPSITIVGPGGSRATFYANFQVAVGDKSWHRNICAPIADGPSPPTSPDGHWVLSGSASWSQIITSVSMVQLPIDFTSQPSEEVGYDNICMTPGNCGTPHEPEIKGCLKDSKVAVICNKDGTYTVTLTGAGNPGDMLSLNSQTSGVTVSPPQQPWAATTTWTISGGSAGQSITLTANATRQGGGSIDGTDQCCSGEIKIALPDCPKDETVDVGINKTGATTPAQQPFYVFDLTVTNNGAAFTGANNITVTDTVPPNMTFNSVGDGGTNWNCTPPGGPAGTVITCTYIGPGVSTGQVLTPNHIDATATGGAPYPPVTNCATVSLGGSYTDTNASNNTSCVTVTKPSGDQFGELLAVKKVVTIGPLPVPAQTYPVTVTCGSNSVPLNLVDNVTQTAFGSVAYGTQCQFNEPTPPVPPGACPPSWTGTWTTAYAPSNPITVNAVTQTVTITNTLTCTPSGDGDKTASIQVKKVIAVNDSTLDLSSQTFPVTVTCGGSDTPLTLTNGATLPVGSLNAGTSCSATETLPPDPATGCGVKRAFWLPATVSPPSVNAASGGSPPTLTITNRLVCERGGFIAVDKKLINNTQADVSGLTFPVTVTCHPSGGNDMIVSLTLTPQGEPQLVNNVHANLSCVAVETLPPAPTTGCPAGQSPQWDQITYSSSPLITVDGRNAITVTNTLNCVRAPSMPPPPAGPKCPPPKIAGADGKTCVCPAGSAERRGKCVVTPTCVSPARLNKSRTACECPRGMELKGRTCVERERKPRITPGDVIRVIPGIGGGGGGRKGGGDHRGGGGGDRKGGPVR